MTDEELIADLKQFITSTVHGEINGALGPMDERFDNLQGQVNDLLVAVEEHRAETRAGFAGVGDAVDRVHGALDEHESILDKHEQAMTKMQAESAV